MDWYTSLLNTNTRHVRSFSISRNFGLQRDLRLSYQKQLRRIANGLLKHIDAVPKGYGWPLALNCLALCLRYEVERDEQSAQLLQSTMHKMIDQTGNWRIPIDATWKTMIGYVLCFIYEHIESEWRYKEAAHTLYYYLATCPRREDGCLPYNQRSEEVFVDTIGMICPFLTRYARIFNCPEAAGIAAHQIEEFLNNNVDSLTGLPYHAYYANGPYKLGLQGWGRGTGWFMLGLVDSIIEGTVDISRNAAFLDAFLKVSCTLQKFQQPQGHWSWLIPVTRSQSDSSVTSFCGYAMARAYDAGILHKDYIHTIERAVQALKDCTDGRGVVHGSSAEATGVGGYVPIFRPQPWSQGASASLAILYKKIDGRSPQ